MKLKAVKENSHRNRVRSELHFLSKSRASDFPISMSSKMLLRQDIVDRAMDNRGEDPELRKRFLARVSASRVPVAASPVQLTEHVSGS